MVLRMRMVTGNYHTLHFSYPPPISLPPGALDPKFDNVTWPYSKINTQHGTFRHEKNIRNDMAHFREKKWVILIILKIVLKKAKIVIGDMMDFKNRHVTL